MGSRVIGSSIIETSGATPFTAAASFPASGAGTVSVTTDNGGAGTWHWGDGDSDADLGVQINHIFAAGTFTIQYESASPPSAMTGLVMSGTPLTDVADLSGLSNLVQFAFTFTSTTSLDLSAYTTLTTLTANNNALLTSLTPPVSLIALDASQCPALTTLVTTGGLGDLATLNIYGCGFTSFSCDDLVSLGSLDIHGCPALASLDIATPANNNLNTVLAGACVLPSSAVDTVLVDLAAGVVQSNVFDGTVDLAGQTPAAPPGASGVAAAAYLVGTWNWVVTTD
jgi:hypothetical protein